MSTSGGELSNFGEESNNDVVQYEEDDSSDDAEETSGDRMEDDVEESSGDEVENNNTGEEDDVEESLGDEVENNNTELGTDGHEFKLGIIARDEENACDMYKSYALSKGFGIRKDHRSLVPGTNICHVRKIVCACEGFKRPYKGKKPMKAMKISIRTGCLAHAQFKRLDNGMYELWRFDDVHNHQLVPKESRHQIRCHRSIPAPAAAMMDGLRNARIGPRDTYRVMAETAGGFGSVGFTEKDCENYIYSSRENHFAAGDCQAMMDHFRLRQSQDPLYYTAVQLDHSNRMTNVFWRDGAAAQNYQYFGDVVVFDTTFKTNRYDMVCAPFIGVNNHHHNIYFGCSFLLAEDTKSFVWLFEAFLASMDGVAPKTIFTDEDHAMKSAIKKVFPNTQHRLCIWHIGKNAKTHLGNLNMVKGFKMFFAKLLYDVESPEEFEELWGQMLSKYQISEHTRGWLEGLYNKKEMWSPAYGREIFTADMQSTQRSESANHAFKTVTTSRMPLTQFLNDFENINEKLREDERRDNYKCFTGKPNVLAVGVHILEHGASIYTHAAFGRFQSEVLDSYPEQIVGFDKKECGSVYKIQRGHQGKYHYVIVGFDEISIACSCKLWELTGWFCGHVVRVMQHLGWKAIPDQYILKRWTKDLRFSESLSIPPASSRLDERKRSMVMSLTKLVRRSFEVMNLCAQHDDTTLMAEEILQTLQKKCKQYRAKNKLLDVHEVDESSRLPRNGHPILDPERRMRKASRIHNGKRKGRKTKGHVSEVRDNNDRVPEENTLEESAQMSGGVSIPPFLGHHDRRIGSQTGDIQSRRRTSDPSGLGQGISNPVFSSQVPIASSSQLSFTELLSQNGGMHLFEHMASFGHTTTEEAVNTPVRNVTNATCPVDSDETDTEY